MSDLRFTIPRDEFADAVGWVGRVLPSRSLNPVLGGIRVAALGHQLALSAYDYEVSADMTVGADIFDGGSVVVSGRLLQAVTKALSRKPVEFHAEGNTARITCGAAEFTLPMLVAEEYPELPAPPGDAGSVDASQFADAVSQTLFATHRGDGNQALKAVCFDVGASGLTLAATDRYRIAARTIPWQPVIDGGDAETQMLVPARALGDVARLGGDTVHLGFAGVNANLVGFRGDSRRTITQLIGEDFPKYELLFPSEHTTVAAAPTADLVEPLARVLALDGRESPRVQLQFAEGRVRMLGGEEGVGGFREDVDIDFCGDPIDIWVNPKYLLEGLQATKSDKVVLGLTAPKRPILIAAHDGGAGWATTAGRAYAAPCSGLQGDYRYLLMPARPSVA